MDATEEVVTNESIRRNVKEKKKEILIINLAGFSNTWNSIKVFSQENDKLFSHADMHATTRQKKSAIELPQQ